ncbi:MAG: FlgD immunoglobulin-like domain containing protein [Candidatus Eiseniibacteriota bacterium]
MPKPVSSSSLISRRAPARRLPGRPSRLGATIASPASFLVAVAVAVLGVAVAHAAAPAAIAGTAAAADGMARPAADATRAVYDLLVVGDSITEGVPVPPGFREPLYNLLNAGSDTYVFQGSSGSAPFEGHFLAGARVEQFFPVSAGGDGTFDVTGDMGAGGPGTAPDVVAIHLGTNNVSGDPPPYVPYSQDHGQSYEATPAGDMGKLVEYLSRWATGAESFDLEAVVLSLITPIQGRTADVEAWNDALVALSEDFAEGVPTGTPLRVALADHYARFLTNPQLFTGLPGDWMTTGDPLHPDEDGYAQMADVYRDAIEQALTDLTAPAAISDLVASTSGDDAVTVTFTASGDDGMSGVAARYDLRYATSAIDAGNFAFATQVRGEPAPASAGAGEAIVVDGLNPGTIYYFAVKVVDDGGNRSGISNVDLATTTGAGSDIVDDFNRPSLGPNWNADPEYAIVSNELANTSIDQTRIDFIATYVAMSNPLGAGLRWPASTDPQGRNQAGLALRLDSVDPDLTNGYLLFRDDPAIGNPNRWNLSLLQGGQIASSIGFVTSSMPAAPSVNDTIRVLLSSDASGHHFDILVNGDFDVRISDPNRLVNSATYYVGYMSRGGLNNNIDDFTLITTPGGNLPPGPFDLVRPADGAVLSTTTPVFDWTPSFDPDPGDVVTYTLLVSEDPGFSPSQTTVVSGIGTSQYTWSGFLERNLTYYWKVRARDQAGEMVESNQTWSFEVPNLLSVVDDFERAELGDDWVAAPIWVIDSGELANDDGGTGFSMAVYDARTNPTAVSLRMGVGADSTGFNALAGLALGLDSASPTASGYMVYRNWNPYYNWQLAEISSGSPSPLGGPAIADANLAPPEAGDVIQVVFTSDGGGHHFDIFVNGVYDTRVTDPDKRQANGSTLYAGYIAAGNAPNNIDDFTLTGVDFNSPPAAFDLVGPPDGSLVITLAPPLSWTEALDPNPDDQVRYRVIYDTDPAFPSPDSLPATTELSTPFTGPMLFGESYYWKVRAYDLAGASVFSNQSWSFSMASILSITDDFDRQELGPNWTGDAALQIEQVGMDGELANTATSGFNVGAYNAATNPDAVSITWGANATATGIQRGGLALMLDEASGSPNGYYVNIDPLNGNRAYLWTLIGGGFGVEIMNVVGQTGAPGTGAVFRVALSSDAGGHHFDLFVNDNFHSRLTDPDRRQGNGPELYAGVALRAGHPNNVDDFTMTAFNFGPPPGSFALLEPEHEAIDVQPGAPLRWESAGDPGMFYVVYLGTDSTFVAGTLDSVSVQGDTTLTWPAALPLDTDLTWTVRATDGQQSRFNDRGWHRFRTTATPVELSRFEAIGDVGQITVLWSTRFERDHLGFHLWRAPASSPEAFERLTDALIGPDAAEDHVYTHVDRDVVGGETYLYRLEAIDRSGGSESYGPVRGTARGRPFVLALAQNVPNPFNPTTRIAYELPAPGVVRLAVYDIDGRLVRRLVDGERDAGPHTARWDGVDRDGRPVSSGIYFSRLEADGRVLTRKMLLVK